MEIDHNTKRYSPYCCNPSLNTEPLPSVLQRIDASPRFSCIAPLSPVQPSPPVRSNHGCSSPPPRSRAALAPLRHRRGPGPRRSPPSPPRSCASLHRRGSGPRCSLRAPPSARPRAGPHLSPAPPPPARPRAAHPCTPSSGLRRQGHELLPYAGKASGRAAPLRLTYAGEVLAHAAPFRRRRQGPGLRPSLHLVVELTVK